MAAVALLFLGCSGGGSSGGSASAPFSFSVSTTDFGGIAYTCDPGSSGVTTLNGFLANCDESPNGGTTQITDAVVQLAGYHGSDTYAFQGSDDTTASFVQFTMANHDFHSGPASPGIPATSCSVVVTGPATLAKGDTVTATFHCDEIPAFVVIGDGGYHPPMSTTADGQFAGTVVF
ncbi:MAG TPA: hypothetical protein VIJ22_16565 [Polyangiaceae bacterium]